ncbi:MAG: 50S ribosomal protein L3 N(5)-glutamine methyltransferase, partial [Cupriavidus sp.]|nr:50S ribosomal protein L3 N(5)-glutamine methyltransferase [Cupriavidus sp.]
MPTPSPLKTVRDLLRLAVSRFTAAKLSFGHGSANAYDEAAYLVLHTLSLPLDTLDPFLDARLLPEEIDAVLKVIDRRVTERVPAAYITHEAFMHGLRFYVDSRVIVPRSFIGELLQDGLEPWLGDIEQIGPVLELCTGSGCLPIIAAHVWPNARIDAVDISSDALAVARRNVAYYKMEDRIALYEGDLYAPLPSGATYDVILTNP